MRGDGSSEDGSADPRAARRYGRLLSGPPRLRAATEWVTGRRKATRLAEPVTTAPETTQIRM